MSLADDLFEAFGPRFHRVRVDVSLVECIARAGQGHASEPLADLRLSSFALDSRSLTISVASWAIALRQPEVAVAPWYLQASLPDAASQRNLACVFLGFSLQSETSAERIFVYQSLKVLPKCC